MPQQLQDIGAMKGTKDTPSHSKKNSCEQWDLSNSWLKACDLFVLARQTTFSKDFSFKKVSTPKFIWFQEHCFSILIFFSFKLTHRLVCYYASCPQSVILKLWPKKQGRTAWQGLEKMHWTHQQTWPTWIPASWSRIGSPPDRSANNKTPPSEASPVVPVLPNDLCHWVLQSQCPRSLGKKKTTKATSQANFGMIHPVTEESEHPNHCTGRHLWVLAHQPGGNGELIPNDLKFSSQNCSQRKRQ